MSSPFIMCLATVTLLQELRGDLLLKAMRTTHTTVLPGTPRLFELLLTNIHTQIAKISAPVRTIIGMLLFMTRQIRAYSDFNPGTFLFRSLHEHFGGRLTSCISAGAAFPAEVHTGLEAFGFDMFEGYGYGLTEATP